MLAVVWSMLAGSHAGGSASAVRPDVSIDRPDVSGGKDVLVLA